MAVNPPTLVVEYATAGTWSNPSSWVDITTSVAAIEISRGRSYEMDSPEAGTLNLRLDNATGDFTPGRAGRAHPSFDIGTVVRVRTTAPVSAYLATATVEEISVSASGVSEATVSCVDYFKQMGAKQMPNVFRATVLSSNPGPYYYLPMDAGGSTWDVTEPTLCLGAQPISFSVRRASGSAVGRITGGSDAPFIASRTGGSWSFNRQVTSSASPDYSWLESDYVASDLFAGAQTDYNGVTIEFWFKCPPEISGGSTGNVFAIADGTVPGAGDDQRMAITFDDSSVSVRLSRGSITVTATATTSVRDDSWHYFQYTYGTKVTSEVPYAHTQYHSIYIDGNQVYTSNLSGFVGPTIPYNGRIYLGGGVMNSNGSHNGYRGEIAHFEIRKSPSGFYYDPVGLARDGGIEGDRSRISRLCSLAGISFNNPGGGSGYYTLAGMDYGESWNVLDVIKSIATVDAQGICFIDGKGSLTYKAARDTANPTTAYTFTADATSAPEAGMVFDSSDSRVLNVVTVTGNDETVTVQDSASVDRFGPRGQDFASALNTSDARRQVAAWIVARQANASVRLDEVTINPSSVSDGSLWSPVLSIDLASCITVANLPAFAPSSSMDLVVEGLKHSIVQVGGAFQWTTTYSTSPKATVWVLEDATYGLLDSSAILSL